MIKKILKYFSIIITPIAILALIAYISVLQLPEKIYINDSMEVSDISVQNQGILNTAKLNKDKVNIDFLGLIPIKSVAVQKLEDIKLYPGGASVGIKLSTEGVLVVGFSNVETDDGSELSPAKVAGMQLGDVLLEVNNKKIESSKQLISLINSANSSTINVEFMRNGCKFNKDINLIKVYNAMLKKALEGDVNSANWLVKFSESSFFNSKKSEIDSIIEGLSLDEE